MSWSWRVPDICSMISAGVYPFPKHHKERLTDLGDRKNLIVGLLYPGYCITTSLINRSFTSVSKNYVHAS